MTDKRLEKAKAALKARQTSFPVLVLDGSMQTDPANFRATIYGADYQPVAPETTDMTGDQVRTGQHFMMRMRTREEFNAEKAKVSK